MASKAGEIRPDKECIACGARRESDHLRIRHLDDCLLNAIARNTDTAVELLEAIRDLLAAERD